MKVIIEKITKVNEKEVLELKKYNYIGGFHEGLAWFYLNGKYGFINKEGKEVLESKKYDGVRDFHEGLAIIRVNDKYGLINKNGEEITDICFECIEIFDDIIIFDRKYVALINDLSFEYECVLEREDNVRVMRFDTIKQRNEFYNYITRKKEKEEKMLSLLEELMKKELLKKKNKSYSDILISAEKEYAKMKKMG